ncbi:hypothetical protein [Ralstonia sp.]|uniref:hypothetical protein n=1 Tax=Ralstonia sp. TaxID=54061 RepID=UPI00257C2297|nr:hypothetical protein [Ralstonia sp.]MBA4203301.1 hypothetical protein [Ralstonia sp.]
MADFHGSISMVRYAPEQAADNGRRRAIDFFFDGVPWRGYLDGMSDDIELGADTAANASLAISLMLDQRAHPLGRVYRRASS